MVVGVDGVDGAGKTTLVAGLVEAYRSLSIVATKPFGNPHDMAAEGSDRGATVSQVLYDFALNTAYGFDDVETQLALTVCARRHERVIVEQLRQQHGIVVTDRCALSAAAYSAAIDERMRALVDWTVCAIAIEDVVFWLDVDPDVAFARRVPKQFLRQPGPDVILGKGTEYQRAASREFRRLATEAGNVIRIDASKPADIVQHEVTSILNPLVGR